MDEIKIRIILEALAEIIDHLRFQVRVLEGDVKRLREENANLKGESANG